MIASVRFIYVAIPVAVSAFAAYGSGTLLLLNLLLLPIFLRRKEDTLTPILALCTAIFSFLYISTTVPQMTPSGPATISLTWTDNAKIDGGRLKGFAKTTSGETVYATYKFKSEAEKIRFYDFNLPAMTFTLSGTFKDAEIPSHQYAFNMKKYMRMYGASGIFESETIVSATSTPTVFSRLTEQRQKVKKHIHAVFPPSLIVEAEALLIGDRSGMDEEDATTYRRLGITHLFAISGLHVGLFTFMLRELLLRLSIRRETVDLLLIMLLPLYAVIAGGAPSVWRAVSVTVLVLVMLRWRIKLRLDTALAVCATAFILYEPFILFQPGFQLSYGAAFSLVYSSAILAKVQTAIGMSFLVTSISQLTLYPILLVHFHELSLSAFFVNVFYVPLYSIVILPANIILVLLSALYLPAANVLFFFYEPFRTFITSVTNGISALPYQLWTPGKPTVPLAVFAVVGVLYFLVKYEEGMLIRRCLPYAIVPALCIHLLPYTDGTLRVTFLDVGQGDGAVIELPYKRAVYIIDTGGTVTFGERDWKSPEKFFEVGRKIVVPYLKGRGITTVDKLIISHAHLDHMGGADEVVEEVRVKEVHITPNSEKEKEMEPLMRLIEAQNIPLIQMKDGRAWMEDKIAFTYLSPQDENYVGNDSSLALLMKTAGPSFLFTGDMETEAEEKFVQKYGRIDFGQVILKAGHHGSKTSSTDPFVNTIRPQLAVISAGKNNMYKHPHQETLDTFEKYRVPTLVTAEQGSITVAVNKNSYSVSTMAK